MERESNTRWKQTERAKAQAAALDQRRSAGPRHVTSKPAAMAGGGQGRREPAEKDRGGQSMGKRVTDNEEASVKQKKGGQPPAAVGPDATHTPSPQGKRLSKASQQGLWPLATSASFKRCSTVPQPTVHQREQLCLTPWNAISMQLPPVQNSSAKSTPSPGRRPEQSCARSSHLSASFPGRGSPAAVAMFSESGGCW